MNALAIDTRVTFHFSTHPPIHGYLKHIPQDTGDCWVIDRVEARGMSSKQKLFYIQQFDFMEVHD